jgi:membrane-associated phospholipid phosphatase
VVTAAPSRRWLLAVLVAAVASLTLLAVAVSESTFLAGETAILEAANDVPAAVGWPLRVLVMQLGTPGVGLAVVLVTAALRHDRGPAPALAVLVAVGVAFRLDNVLKAVIERPRPSGLLEGIEVRDHVGGFGFPSGHTTMACAIAASLHPILSPTARWIVWALAALVGAARMYVGAHWPADVVAGAALGIAIASAAWLLVGLLPLRADLRPARAQR